MEVKAYKNEYGELTIEPVTDYVPISTVSFQKTPEVRENLFDINTAEKVALITENRGIQVCFPLLAGRGPNNAYVVIHKDASTVAVGKVTLNDFQCELSAGEEINRLARTTFPPV